MTISENVITIWQHCILLNLIHFREFESIQIQIKKIKLFHELIQCRINSTLNCETRTIMSQDGF